MPDATRDRQLLHQAEEPSHRARCFDPHDDRRRNRGTAFANGLPFVPQRLLDDHTVVAIQHRNRLLARMYIATDQSHLGLLQSERGERGRRTVYACRSEADVVMTSMCVRVNSKCAHQVRPPVDRMEALGGP